MKAAAFFFLAALAALPAAVRADDPAKPPAPAKSADVVDATFTTEAGKTVRLSDWRGKKAVVLLFMRGFTGEYACYHCGVQTEAYKARYEEVRTAGAEVLMVLPGTKVVRGFLDKVGEQADAADPKKYEVPFPVVLDADLSACKTFGVAFANPIPEGAFAVDEPATIVVGKDGTVLYAYHGKNPSDRPALDAVLAALTGKKPEPAPPPKEPADVQPKSVVSWTDYAAGVAASGARRRPLFLEFYADW
jgi:peroxiredoxin